MRRLKLPLHRIRMLALLTAAFAMLGMATNNLDHAASPRPGATLAVAVTTAPTPHPTPSPSSSPTASPSPAPTAPSSQAKGCGWLDVGCKVGQAINNWFRSLVASALNPAFGLLGQTLLSTPQVDQMPTVQTLWTSSLAIANTCFILFVVVGGILLMSHGTAQTSYALKDVAPRLVIAIVAANMSLMVVGRAIELANGLSAAILGPGVNPETASHALTQTVAHAVMPGDAALYLMLLGNIATGMCLVLVCVFIVRIMLTILLVAAAPLALICHALPQTDALARLWWRAIAGCLAIQVCQALAFIAAMKIFFTHNMGTTFGVRSPQGAFELLLVLCLLYILMRIPSWVFRMVWRRGMNSSPLVRIVRTAAAILIFRSLGAARAGTAARGGRAVAAGRPARALPPAPISPTSPPPTATENPWAQPQPRWAHPDQRWTAPGPYPQRGGPAPDGVAAQQRWGNPGTTWQPPYTGPWQGPAPQPRKTVVIEMKPPPRPGDPWARPR